EGEGDGYGVEMKRPACSETAQLHEASVRASDGMQADHRCCCQWPQQEAAVGGLLTGRGDHKAQPDWSPIENKDAEPDQCNQDRETEIQRPQGAVPGRECDRCDEQAEDDESMDRKRGAQAFRHGMVLVAG